MQHVTETQAPVTAGRGVTARDLAFGGLFGAAALLLPTLFHVLQLGHVFMPMYLPLVALAFLVSPRIAVLTALMVPLVSAAVTGMPPLFPPVAFVMATELALMALCIGVATARFPDANPLLILVPVLLLGRVVNFLLMYAAAALLDLPAGFVAGLSLLSGWPGIILMIVVVPALVLAIRRRGAVHA